MKKEIINKIISKMEQDLSPVQLKKLENVLSEFQDKQYPITHTTKKNNFIKQFSFYNRVPFRHLVEFL